MSNIARPLQHKLAERFVVGRPETALEQTSADETGKFLFRFRDGEQVETVYIPIRRRSAARCACRRRSGALCLAGSATRARSG